MVRCSELYILPCLCGCLLVIAAGTIRRVGAATRSHRRRPSPENCRNDEAFLLLEGYAICLMVANLCVSQTAY